MKKNQTDDPYGYSSFNELSLPGKVRFLFQEAH